MLNPILLLLIPRFHILIKMPIRLSQIFNSRDSSRVIGCHRRAAQALAEDLVAGAQAKGVEGLREESGLEL